MKTIRNKTPRPLRVPLPGGRFLHLGPGKTGQIADHAIDRGAVQALVKAGSIEVVGEGGRAWGGGQGEGAAHEATHGHSQPTVVLPKGNR
jgi:hypothetical protein